MRHPKKSVLADVLKMKQSHHKGKKRNLKNTGMEIEVASTINEDQFLNEVVLMEDHVIIDGGALLHQTLDTNVCYIKPGSTFQEVINKYCRYLSSKYKICQIVFDGYKSRINKYHKQARREAYNPPCPDVLVNENVNVLHSREEFLILNSNNKQQVIKLLAKHSEETITLSLNAKLMQICRLLFLHLIFPAKTKR